MTTNDNMPRRGWKVMRILKLGIVGIIFTVIFALVFGVIVQYLWNWLMPGLFGIKTITLLQAFVLIIISKILFSGFGHPMGMHGRHMRHGHFDGRSRHGFHAGFLDDDRKYFRQYWVDEGKAAFNASFKEYVKRAKQSGGTDQQDETKTDKSSR